DRFLIGILVFIGLLVAAALALYFIQPQTASYQPDDTPEGVVYNFALAIQDRDVERAYSYLADLDYKPTESAFRQAILNGYLYTDGYALQVEETQMLDADEAWVIVTIHYLSSGPFDSGWSSPDHAELVRQLGEWKIKLMPYPYWSYDWFQPPYDPAKP
ncbi:MAG: hypothetical protein AB1531_01085, partial [Chloroflexota bacterium]